MVKRIYNPVTKNYYLVTQRIRNSSNGKEIEEMLREDDE